MRPVTFRLEQQHIDYLEKVGRGNRSKALRKIIEATMNNMEVDWLYLTGGMTEEEEDEFMSDLFKEK